MSREKVSISLDKDEKSLRTFNLQHMVKAMPLTLWHLTNFLVKKIAAIDANHKSTRFFKAETLNDSPNCMVNCSSSRKIITKIKIKQNKRWNGKMFFFVSLRFDYLLTSEVEQQQSISTCTHLIDSLLGDKPYCIA